MSVLQEANARPPARGRRRLHWTVVAALWTIAAAWIAVDPLTGPHSTVTNRWMMNVSILIIAAAATTLIGWLIQVMTIEPINDERRTFALAYQAGRYDALNEGRPTLGVVADLPGQRGRTGT